MSVKWGRLPEVPLIAVGLTGLNYGEEKEKEKDKIKEKEKDSKEKEKDKKTFNGHAFSSIPVVGPINCSQCMKPFTNKDAYTCANCSTFVHKGCRESLASCAKVKMKVSYCWLKRSLKFSSLGLERWLIG
uniref:Phorbol-ester/DAG-type domain-containing protein n=1 Tax=Jaculus jaculus TaxID=51337 RepID=A0A8C5LBB8_JACJA